MIDSYKKQVQAAQDIPDAQRDSILRMYDMALDQLKLADYWQAQGLKADETTKRVPEQLEKANAKIQLPVEDLTPHVPQGASLQQIEQLYKEAEELDRAARLEAGSLVREQKACQDRAQEIQNRHTAIRQTLAGLSEQMNNLQAASSPADQAQRVLLRTQRRALWREFSALDKQRASDEARQELLTVQVELGGRFHDATSKALAAWQDILKQRRVAETAKVAAQASQQSLTFKDRPELFAIAEQNKDLTNRRVELQNLTDQIQRTIHTREAVADLRRSLADNNQSMMKRIETAGLTEAVSSSLRRHRAQLPDILQHERSVRRLEGEIARANIDLIDIEDQRTALTTPAGIDRQIEQILKNAKKPIAPEEQDALRAQLRELLRTKRTYLGDLIRDYSASIRTWFELLEEERLLIAETRKYANYIDEHILWVRSTRPLQAAHVRTAWPAALWLVDPDSWIDAGKALLTDFRANPLTVLSGLLLFVWLLAIRVRFRLRLRRIDEIASKGYTYAFSQTLQALGLTLLLAIPAPGLLWFVGWRLSWSVAAGDFTGALAAGLRATAGIYLALEILRQVCRKRGLGQTHFHWPAPATKLLRNNLAWLIAVALPLVFIHTMIDSQTNTDYRDSLGRLAFIAGMIALAAVVRRILRPSGPLMADFLQQRRDGWLDRLRYLWYPLAIAAPAALALAAAFGYYYTAMQLTTRVLATIGLVFVTLIAKGLLLRLLFVARRKLALETIEKRKAARAQAIANEQPVPSPRSSPLQVDAETSAPAAPAEPEIDLAAVDVQTRRLLRVAVLLALVLGLYVTWVDMLPALGILDRVQLWSTTVDVSQTITQPDGTQSTRTIQKLAPITLASVAWAGLIVLIAVAAARNIPGLLEITVLRLMPLEPGGRYAINAISRYIITIFGLIFAFGAIGIGWSKVQWLAAAVTVGLGFGLQEIFANFVSGIIILFERPIRVGDVISVGPISGTVSKIRIRATTIVDWNRKELIVPNKQFITGQMVNWTLTDSILRLVISVGVPYGSDPDLVRSMLLRIARSNPHVLETPKPSVFLLSVTNTALDFSLRVFVPSPDTILAVQDELHTAIDEALREAGIEVAFSRSPG
jgi:potassium efflux system protein